MEPAEVPVCKQRVGAERVGAESGIGFGLVCVDGDGEGRPLFF